MRQAPNVTRNLFNISFPSQRGQSLPPRGGRNMSLRGRSESETVTFEGRTGMADWKMSGRHSFLDKPAPVFVISDAKKVTADRSSAGSDARLPGQGLQRTGGR